MTSESIYMCTLSKFHYESEIRLEKIILKNVYISNIP